MKRTALLSLILLSISLNVMANDVCRTGSGKASGTEEQKKDEGKKKDQFDQQQ